MHVERAERRHYKEVRQDERPAAGPRPPEAAAKIGDEDPDLDRERPWQRLADGDRLAHLLAREPAAAGDEVALHETDQRDRAAKAGRAEAEEIGDEFAHRTGRHDGGVQLCVSCCSERHQV